jgi:hypothetical protein
MSVPFLDLRAAYLELKDEIDAVHLGLSTTCATEPIIATTPNNCTRRARKNKNLSPMVFFDAP